jgi:hypothetical protein
METMEEARDTFVKNQWRHFNSNGKEVVFTKVFDNVITCMNSVKDIGAAAASCDLTHGAVVAWQGIKFFVKVSAPNPLYVTIETDKHLRLR